MLCMLTHYYSQGAGDMEQRGKVIYVIYVNRAVTCRSWDKQAEQTLLGLVQRAQDTQVRYTCRNNRPIE